MIHRSYGKQANLKLKIGGSSGTSPARQKKNTISPSDRYKGIAEDGVPKAMGVKSVKSV